MASRTQSVRTERVEARDPPINNRSKRGGQEPIEELEAGLAIDEHALDEALVCQPDFFYRVAKRLALEISRRDAAKQALQDAEFEAEVAARRAAEEAEKKVTDSAIRAVVQTDDAVRAARDDLMRLSESVGTLSSLKEAFTQRSYAIKDLVNLYVANYYTASEHTTATGAMRDRLAQDARQNMNDERRRRAR